MQIREDSLVAGVAKAIARFRIAASFTQAPLTRAEPRRIKAGTISMMKTILAAAAILSTAVPVLGTSYYPARPKDGKAVYLSPDRFPVKGDGIADDSAVLQQAINKVRETTNQGILFVPAGRYRLTRTIYIWPGIRLIGFG
ncbi:MAG TPA: glycosyl hydrolase family 28-related protein, partial [Candidatus Acidoferrum sp.]|nr:glycosyl hydrolase family 28-related protein [Candidatus Acidoferrum sp.]